MTDRISYTRRTLPQESKQVPPPRPGRFAEPNPLAAKKDVPATPSGPLPLFTAVIPSSRISTPR